MVSAEVMYWVSSHANSNSFANSLHNFYNRKGYLSDGQVAAVQKILDKVTQPKPQPTVTIAGDGFKKMIEVFATARSNGYKTPRVRTEDFDFSAAPSSGMNAGYIYVKLHHSGIYFGKISPEGAYFPSKDANQELLPALTAVCENPLAAAVRYGAKTGNCSCCGRELSNKESVELGIGPICRRKYFGF